MGNMKIKIIISALFMSLGCMTYSYSQTIIQPNSGLKSHETLDIQKIEITPNSTTVSLSVENRREGGTFCADKNIYIIYPDGTRTNLVKSNNIPVCPKAYNFKRIGEKLQFTIEFPPLKAGTEWIDIIEDCSDNCFSFYGVVLNNDLNRKIDAAVALVDQGAVDGAIDLYKKIIQNDIAPGNGITGSLYTDLISLLSGKGYKADAADWYKKMLASKAPRLQLYINNLNSRGIKF
jgi:hypothetical protein